jgi:ABC-type ATPase with predicted acetyltransferase domain
MARKLQTGTVIDEFTSVVNRETAKSCSVALSKYIKRNNLKNIVLATCHEDILSWLEPDWVYCTDIKS